MTPKARRRLYWPLWHRVCQEINADPRDNARRYAFHLANGLPESTKTWRHHHLDTFISAAYAILGKIDVRDRERERLLHALAQLRDELGPFVLRAIAIAEFDIADPQRLTNPQLLRLLPILRIRAKAQRKTLASASTQPPGPSPTA